MIEILMIDDMVCDNEISKEIGDMILVNNGSELYKIDGKWIFFKSENKDLIKNQYNIITFKGYIMTFNDYLNNFDGGEYFSFRIVDGYKLDIGIIDCINYLQDNINIYEERIYNSNDISSEINKILKEVFPIVAKSKADEIKKNIYNQCINIKKLVNKNSFEWS